MDHSFCLHFLVLVILICSSQIYELHSKNLELEKRNDKAEFEAKRAKEKQQTLEAENEVKLCAPIHLERRFSEPFSNNLGLDFFRFISYVEML